MSRPNNPAAARAAAGLLAASMLAAGCSDPMKGALELARYPLDGLSGVIARRGVAFDKAVSADGKGSLRVTAAKPATFALFRTGDLDAEDCRLVYRARIRTRGVTGKVYLEMLCHFQGKGEFFSRGLESYAVGDSEWCEVETPFFLRKGENPDDIKLNLVVNGRGTAWIDSIVLLKGRL